MIRRLTPIAMFCCFILACADAPESTTASGDMELLQDSVKPEESNYATVDTVMPDTEPIVDELIISENKHIDSMLVRYDNKIDTIYGLRSGRYLIVEGDMMFRYPRQGGMKYITGIGTFRKKWFKINNRIKVYYTVNPTFPRKSRLTESFAMWSQKLGIDFIERRSDSGYLQFSRGFECSSEVGRVGSAQAVVITDDASPGKIAHEIGHALGLFHEHSRSDRMQYVVVNPACMNDINYRFALEEDAKDIGSYDYYSIMHYSNDHSCLEIKDKTLPNGIPGQRDSLSPGDRQSIRRIYGL